MRPEEAGRRPTVKLLIKAIDDDGRLAPLRGLLETDWTVIVADHTDRDSYARALRDADALVSMDWPSDSPLAPRLRLIQLPGAGTDEIRFDAVPPSASVCNAFEHEIGIAEFVMAAMLEWLIGLRHLDATLRQDRWQGSFLCGPRHGDLYGRTLVIAGYGRIGREVARRAQAFGMRIVAVNRSPRPGDPFCQDVRPMTALAEAAAEADFLLVTLPLDAQTRGVIGAGVLGAMKPTGVVLNVGRGPTIDEEALYLALRDRRIGGAVIDTWYDYPPQAGAATAVHAPSRFPFRDLDNILMSPHASAWTDALAARRCAVIADNLDRLARGEPLRNVVAPARAGDAAPLPLRTPA